MKKILSLICVGMMVLVGGVVMAGCSNEPYASGVYVYLTQEAVDSGKVYAIEDFSEIDFITNVRTLDYSWINPPRSKLLLTFSDSKHDKKNIEKVMRLLQGRSDIAEVEPCLYGYID